MTRRFKHPAARYGVALLSTAIATLMRMPLTPLLGERVPFGHHLLSVLVTTWIAGTGPGFLALVLGLFASAMFVLLPHGSLVLDEPHDFFALLVYGVVGAVAILLFRHTRTQRALAEQRATENRNLADQLREADRRKDEFLALLAHELRNPIAPIRSGLDLLDRSPGEDQGVEVRSAIRRQVEQLVRIVDDLLDVSRFVRGKVRLRAEVLDAREVVDLSLETIRPALDERGHNVQYHRPLSPLYVRGDRLRLAQVVSNLLSNASKYTPGEGLVTIRIEDCGDQVEIHVQDNGIGIPPESQQAIFGMFAQANSSSSRDHGGLGLGLAIVHGLTDLHGGRVWVHSDGTGRGSRFSVGLPRVEPPSPEELTRPAGVVPVSDRIPSDTTLMSSTTDTAIFNLEDVRVLIVDDNRDAATMLGALIALEGYETRVVHEGRSAIESVASFRPDIVLLDIGLPGMDGYEVARRIVAKYGEDRPRLVAVTGWGGPEDRRKTAEAGFDHHLVKPVATETLLAQLAPGSKRRATTNPIGVDSEFV